PARAAQKDLYRLREAVDEVAGKRGLKRAQAIGFELQGARRRGNRLAVVIAQQAIPHKADRHARASPVSCAAPDFSTEGRRTEPFRGRAKRPSPSPFRWAL